MALVRVDTFPTYLVSAEFRNPDDITELYDTFTGGDIVEDVPGAYTIDVGSLTGNWLVILQDENDDTIGTRYASPDYLIAQDTPPWLAADNSEVLTSIDALIALFRNPSLNLVTRELYYYNNEVNPVKTITTPDYTARSIKVRIETKNKVLVANIANASLTKTSTSVAFILGPAVTSEVRLYNFSLRDTTTDEVLGEGTIKGLYAP